MPSSRMEAFSDGVIAILITIMVFNINAPQESDLAALYSVLPSLLSFLLSFVYLGIYWNNHHHMLQLTDRINGGVLWANLHLLFWLSLLPFATRWLHLSNLPVAVYGIVLLLSGVAYVVLQWRIVKVEGAESRLGQVIGSDYKGKISMAGYALGIPLAFFAPIASVAIYVAVALVWLIPDQRIETHFHE